MQMIRAGHVCGETFRVTRLSGKTSPALSVVQDCPTEFHRIVPGLSAQVRCDRGNTNTDSIPYQAGWEDPLLAD